MLYSSTLAFPPVNLYLSINFPPTYQAHNLVPAKGKDLKFTTHVASEGRGGGRQDGPLKGRMGSSSLRAEVSTQQAAKDLS